MKKKNKVKFNISHAHYALLKRAENGKISFDKPVPVPGSRAVTLSPEGERTVFYADGVEYYTSRENGGYSGDWELAYITDQMREEILKEIKDKRGILFEVQDVEDVEFAFGFQIDGDQHGSRFWFYCCMAARPETAAETNEGSKTPQTDTLSLTVVGVPLLDNSEQQHIRARTTADTDDTVYQAWFNDVVLPVNEGAAEDDDT
ncbi:MAG: phage tail protein [Clostridia bacterium]|nr:phage tail protein [Clostridia bacterium]